MNDLLLPLFPLEVVLFPRTNLPLHIFEDRYKEMVGECLESHVEFGVVLVQENSLENAGCTASIAQVVRKYDDGRMDIIVRGQRRFEILLLDREKAYLRGAPQFFEDEGDTVPIQDARRGQALELYRQTLELLRSEDHEVAGAPPDLGDAQLSYQIMAQLPVNLAFKQTLLESRSESERLTQVVAHLKKLIERLTLVLRTRARAGGNGQGR